MSLLSDLVQAGFWTPKGPCSFISVLAAIFFPFVCNTVREESDRVNAHVSLCLTLFDR